MSSVSVSNTHICRHERRAQAGQKEVREATVLLGFNNCLLQSQGCDHLPRKRG